MTNLGVNWIDLRDLTIAGVNWTAREGRPDAASAASTPTTLTDMTMCYHGRRNLKSTLAPRIGRFPEGLLTSELFNSYADTE